ncbi:MAG: response regulator [Lachnospiraceae bacterium]|nr:response regulator [Lachnospiraceae bacterium]
MTTTICLISNEVSVSVRAMADGMHRAGTECYTARVYGLAQNEEAKDASFEILYLNDAITAADIKSVEKFCRGNRKKFFLYGTEEQIMMAKGVATEGSVDGFFVRPMNAADIVGQIFDIVLGDDTPVREGPLTMNIDELMNDLAEGRSTASSFMPSKKHILAVDDSGPMLRTIKGWFEPEYKVSLVNSAVNAFTFLAANKPDLILLDYNMPACSGPQFIQMIRSEEALKDIPVFFLTEKGDRKSVQEVVNLKPQGYLLKSMMPSEIITRVREFLDGGPGRRAL